MAITVEVHPTAKRAAFVTAVAVVLCLTLLGIKRLLVVSPAPTELDAHPKPNTSAVFAQNSMVPVIALELDDASLERYWSAALANVLNGQTEVQVESGRVDVLTTDFAIEVDRLEKWHEAIGQALHYASQTKRTPCIALMIPSDPWPLNTQSTQKVMLIDKTSLEKGIKVLLLKRLEPKTSQGTTHKK